jgi:hypothetical protein
VERDDVAFAAGRAEAHADIAAGKPVYRWSGHTGHYGHWIATQLSMRFGVGISDGFGVCFVTMAKLSFDDGYNEVLAAELDRRHGRGALTALFAEARQQSEESLWDAKESWLANHPER